MRISAILFDFFGVICVDQYQHWLSDNKFKRVGKFADLGRRTDSGKINMADFFTGLAELSGQPASKIERDFRQNTDLDAELLDYIIRLKKYYKIGLVTNSSTDWLEIAFDQFHIRHIFDEVVVSGEVGFIKPQPQIYQIAIDRLGVRPDQIVFIDDNPANVAPARKLGMRGVVYNGIEELRKDLASIGVKI